MKTEDKDIYQDVNLYEKLVKENQRLRSEVKELKDRLRWIESLARGAVEDDLARKIRKGE